MKITSAEFVKSVANLNQLPRDGLPEVAFAGRSNVGKSSLLNTLFHRKKLALVSSTPGKTRTLNFYRVNQKYYFVDLPGYGYAKVSKSLHREWKRLIEEYLSGSQHLKGVVVITDLRHPISSLDLELIEWLAHETIPTVVVGTKADKLSGNRLAVRKRENLLEVQKYNISEIIPFSAVNGRGKAELMKRLEMMLIS